jgi:nitrate reductase NapE component
MRPFDLPDQPDPAPKEPLLTRTDLITIALVGIGIITITSVLLVLLF